MIDDEEKCEGQDLSLYLQSAKTASNKRNVVSCVLIQVLMKSKEKERERTCHIDT